MKYADEMASCSMIYMPSLMTTGRGVQARLRISLSNLRGCNVGITDESDYDVRR
jgi:hypothetical protein